MSQERVAANDNLEDIEDRARARAASMSVLEKRALLVTAGFLVLFGIALVVDGLTAGTSGGAFSLAVLAKMGINIPSILKPFIGVLEAWGGVKIVLRGHRMGQSTNNPEN